MTMTDAQFDVITADPIHPRITGVGYLYTKEYYKSLKRRLKPDGLVLQWMPMYNISKRSFDVALRTFSQVYPNSSFWYVRGHGLMVGTSRPLRLNFEKFSNDFYRPEVRKDLASVGMPYPETVLAHLLMDSDHIREYLEQSEDTTINTDDNAYLETRTPFEYLGRTRDIVRAIKPHSGWRIERVFENESSKVRDLIRDAYRQRLDRVLPELDTAVR